jgi:hypothetical protein
MNASFIKCVHSKHNHNKVICVCMMAPVTGHRGSSHCNTICVKCRISKGFVKFPNCVKKSKLWSSKIGVISKKGKPQQFEGKKKNALCQVCISKINRF